MINDCYTKCSWCALNWNVHAHDYCPRCTAYVAVLWAEWLQDMEQCAKERLAQEEEADLHDARFEAMPTETRSIH